LYFQLGVSIGMSQNFQAFGFQVSGVSRRLNKQPVKSKKKRMNVEHRTSNIEHRIMYSGFLKRLSDVWGRLVSS